MEILKQALIDFLKKRSGIDLKEIKRELKLDINQGLLLERCIFDLIKDGTIYEDKNNK